MKTKYILRNIACLFILNNYYRPVVLGAYNASGGMRWSMDDVVIKSVSGKSRNTSFGQNYLLNLNGPLLSPYIGDGSASLTYQQGKNLAQLVSGGSSKQQIFGYAFTGNILPPGLRRLVSAGFNLSKSQNETAWANLPLRTVDDKVSGWRLGFTIPRLPTYQVTRQKLDRQDNAETLSLSEKTVTVNERSTYTKGPVRLDYSREKRNAVDRILGRRISKQDILNSNLDFNLPKIARMGLDSFFTRLSYSRQITEIGASGMQKALSSTVYLTSRHARFGKSDSYVGYNNNFSRNFVSDVNRIGHGLTLYTKWFSPAWDVNNQFKFQQDSGGEQPRSDTVGDNVILESLWFKGLIKYRLQGDETWQRSRGNTNSVSDSLFQRFAFHPAAKFDFYLQQSYRASRIPGNGTQLQNVSWGGGGSWYPVNIVQSGVTYEQGQTKAFTGAGDSRFDSATFNSKIYPLPGMITSLTYSFQRSKSFEPSPAVTRNDTVSAESSYVPYPGVNLTGSVYWTRALFRGLTSSKSDTLNTTFSAGYTIGLTTFALNWESRELSTPNAYRKLSVVVTRKI